METKRTPLPWFIYRGEICYRSDADDQSYGMSCPVDFYGEANAAFIVRAANNHAALVLALEAARAELVELGIDCNSQPSTLDQIDAALALAKGEQV